MPNLHDIERRINSVSSTMQITRTMEMVAAAKITRSMRRMENALPWATSVESMILTASKYAIVDEEPLLNQHDETRRCLLVVISSDRGLASGFNSNVFRKSEEIMASRRAGNVDVDIVACGKKGIGYFNYRDVKPVLEYGGLSADPTYEEAAEIALHVSEQYESGKIDEVVLVYNHAKNLAEQRVVVQQVLPIVGQRYVDLLGIKEKTEDVFKDFLEHPDPKYGDVDFEPSANVVLAYLMKQYLRNAFFFALCDSAAAEQGARRNAMKSATDAAEDMISTLRRIYNSARQGAITTEITEIVSGAAAAEE